MPIPSLSASTSPSTVYVSYTRDSPEGYAVASFQCILKFTSKELDPTTGEPEADGYEDEYQLEDVELSAGGDYIIPSYTMFDSEWEKLESGVSATETFSLSAMESLKGKLFCILSVGSKNSYPEPCQLHVIRLSRSSIWNPWADHNPPHRLLCTLSNCLVW